MKIIMLSCKIFIPSFLLLAPFFSPAQIRTVIPVNDLRTVSISPTKSVTLSFELNTLPEGVIIDSCFVLMSLKKDILGETGVKESYVGSLPPGIRTNKINSQTLYRNNKANSDITVGIDDTRYITGSLSIKKLNISVTGFLERSKAEFYASDFPNRSPRLIIYYHFDNEVRIIDWAGSHADAQHSGRTRMRFGGAIPSGFQVKSLPGLNFSKIMTDLVVYKDQICLFDYTPTAFKMYLVDPVTNSKNYIFDVNPILKMPVIDPSGRLYYIAGNHVGIINLNNFGDRNDTAITLSTTNNISSAPTVGRDGSLYLALNNSINAYTPYPQHKLAWSNDMDGDKSPVALSPNGNIAYVINRQGNLVAINTTNGAILYNKNLVMHNPDINEGVTIPLVTSDGYIYIASKLTDADSMYILDSKLESLPSVGGANISQPVSGKDSIINNQFAGSVFFVNSGNLFQSILGSPSFVSGIESNLSVRSLVADLSNNIYCLGNNKSLYAYINNRLIISPSNIGDTIGFQKAMIIAPDGSLYTSTSSILYTFRATSFSTNYKLVDSTDKQLNDFVFRGDSITVPQKFTLTNRKKLIGVNAVVIGEDVTVDGTANISIETGGTITFKNGFRVKQGATLSCKTGY